MVKRTKAVYSFVKEVYLEFSRDRGTLFSAAISFYGIISLIPLLLIVIGIFGLVLGSYETALLKVVPLAKDYLPMDAKQLEDNLSGLIEQWGTLSGIGFLGLLWAGSQVFATLQQVMNIALGSGEYVGFVRSRLSAFGMVMVSGALFALSIGITSTMAAARNYGLEIGGISIGDMRLLWRITGILIPIIISSLAFAFIYKFLPTSKVGIRGPLFGGITAGVLFEAAKHAFPWYLTHVANYDRIYGSLGGMVILVVWIYYLSLITIIGAEVASVYVLRHKRKQSAAYSR